MLAEHGKIGYLDELMGVYRIHPGGAWSRLKSIERLAYWLAARDMVNEHLNYRYNSIVQASKKRTLYDELPSAVSDKTSGEISLVSVFRICKKVLSDIDKEQNLVPSLRREVWSRVFSDFFFRAHRRGSRIGVLSSYPAMIFHFPDRLLDRGVSAIVFQAIISQKMWRVFKKWEDKSSI